jgi:hypothetical protein
MSYIRSGCAKEYKRGERGSKKKNVYSGFDIPFDLPI